MHLEFTIPLLGFLYGAALIIGGFSKRAQVRQFKTMSSAPIGSSAAGTRTLISGKAYSPNPVISPVSKEPCVFYTNNTERKLSSQEKNKAYQWESGGTETSGGFFIRDDSGTALVVPTPQSLDIQKPELTVTEESAFSDCKEFATKRSERLIRADETITLLGTPRPLKDFMGYLRMNSQLGMNPDFLNELLRLENAPGSSAMPCFFGSGLEKVTDQTLDGYVAGLGSSASFSIPAGTLIAAASAAFLLYALKNTAQPSAF